MQAPIKTSVNRFVNALEQTHSAAVTTPAVTASGGKFLAKVFSADF